MYFSTLKDYNTSRGKLILPEHGRNIQKMVDYILSVPDREERNRLAHSTVAVMGMLNPHLRDINDFKHKLWDHLAILSKFKLDIDWPYPLPTPEELAEKPRRIPYNNLHFKHKYYGKVIELLINKAATTTDPSDKDALIQVIANHMKKQYMMWNKDVVTDDIIFGDIRTISKDRLIIGESMKLSDKRDIKDVINNNKKKNDGKRLRRKK